MSTLPATDVQERSRWSGAWIDALAFAGGLALAWFGEWRTTDLVWSLWLSSLLVGYALIAWTLSATLREFGGNALRDGASGVVWGKLAVGGLLGVGFLLGLAFFTVHFGGFHLVHSVFLQQFFPVGGGSGGAGRGNVFPSMALYGEVWRNYGWFVPLAFLAEREAFRSGRGSAGREDTAVTPEAIARRKMKAMNAPMMAPYKNVIRMHLLIFFFAGAHALRIDHFAVYAVVYAAYFFPWRMIRREEKG